MSFEVIIDKSDKKVLRAGYTTFTIDADVEEKIVGEFLFNPPLSTNRWSYASEGGTFTNGGPKVIEEEPVEIILHRGKDYKLKRKGYTFTAAADQSTAYAFVMPFDGHIQGGHFHAGVSKTGDMIEFIILPGTPYEFKYIESLFVTQGDKYDITEEFGMTDLIPQNTPLKVVYNNTDDAEAKKINFQITYRIPI